MSSVDFNYLINVFEASQGLIPKYIEEIKKHNEDKKKIINLLSNIRSLGNNLFNPLAREHKDLANKIQQGYIIPLSKIIENYENNKEIDFEFLEKTPQIYSSIIEELKRLKQLS